jgi:hypothetical protein
LYFVNGNLVQAIRLKTAVAVVAVAALVKEQAADAYAKG